MNISEDSRLQVQIAGFGQINIAKGQTLQEVSRDFQEKFRTGIVAAKVDNSIEELTFKLLENCRVEFIDLTNEDGIRIYRRSLYFILIKAINELFPESRLVISHSISDGFYCELRDEDKLTREQVEKIWEKMKEIAEKDLPFIKKEISIEQARQLFAKNNRMDRFEAIKYRKKEYVTVYECDGLEDYFYGFMVPSTGYIKSFELVHYYPGFIVRFPGNKSQPGRITQYAEQKKLFNIIDEYKRWSRILEVDNVGALNSCISEGKIGEFIRISEALHEKKVAQIADMIAFNRDPKKLVLISGPSSSGKTTFANRLAIQLRVNGLKPITISLDDYFLNRENTPKDEKGDYDYEALEAIDIALFNRHLASLVKGEEVGIPIFNFQKGCREENCRPLRFDQGNILIVEGIHGLNEALTSSVPQQMKFKIYVSALTSMNIDDHNRIPSTDTRMIRRIVRDHQFRGTTAVNTILRWPSVRRGEEKNIFPFQEKADMMFNSSIIYEHSVLKVYAEPLLMEIDRTSPVYSEAKRLIEFLSYFLPVDSREIPANSILREFIGGSCFY